METYRKLLFGLSLLTTPSIHATEIDHSNSFMELSADINRVINYYLTGIPLDSEGAIQNPGHKAILIKKMFGEKPIIQEYEKDYARYAVYLSVSQCQDERFESYVKTAQEWSVKVGPIAFSIIENNHISYIENYIHQISEIKLVYKLYKINEETIQLRKINPKQQEEHNISFYEYLKTDVPGVNGIPPIMTIDEFPKVLNIDPLTDQVEDFFLKLNAMLHTHSSLKIQLNLITFIQAMGSLCRYEDKEISLVPKSLQRDLIAKYGERLNFDYVTEIFRW